MERLRLLADATTHAVVIHDRGRVLDMNDRFCEMFECTPQEARELDVLQYIRPVEGDRVIGLADPEAVVTQHLIVTAPSGRVREIECAGRPIMYRGQPCRVVSLLDVTARLQAERAVRESERVMREMLENLSLLNVMLDVEGRIVTCNEALCTVSGYTRDQLIGQSWEALLGADDDDDDDLQRRRRVRGDSPLHEDLGLITSSGELRRIAWNNTTVRDPEGTVIGCMSIGEDVTDRRIAEIAAAGRARQQDAVARLGLHGLRAGAPELLQDAVREVAATLAADLVCVLLGSGEDETLVMTAAVGWRRSLIGRHRVYSRPGSLAERVLSARAPVIVDDLASAAESTGAVTGNEGAVSAMGVPIYGPDQESPQGLLMVHTRARRQFTDDDANFLQAVANVLGGAMAREQALERVAHLAFHDELTDLPNRVAALDRLDHLIELSGRDGRAAAVIWVDVDNFQLVNDSFGQRVGDDVLRQVAATLRRVASSAGLVARNTGDEFLIVIGDHSEAGDGSCAKVEDVAQIAQSIAGRVRAAFRSPFDAAGADVFLRPCIGVSVLPVHAQDRDGLLRHADIAKDQTKAALRSGAPRPRSALAPLDEISLTTRLHRALDQGEFVLHYQPVVNIDSGDLVSVEALLRWQDPEHGLVSPGEFIPLAERIGMIGPLTDWVVEEASRQAARWHAQGLVIGVAVNVPAILWHPAAADRLIETVRRHGVDPRLFVVEVTESTAMADPAVSDRVLKRLSDAGLHLAIDDFGTGYSSLSRLRELPASTLKIDRSFVSELGTDPSADVMVQTVVGMARSLGLRPLAEGIETEQQRRILLAHGCRLGQGFLFSRALPASEISRSCALRPAA